MDSNNTTDAISNLMNMLKNNNSQNNNPNGNSVSPEALANMVKMMQNSNNNSSNSEGQPNNFDMDTILKMKSVFEQMNNKNDPRNNLLLSLKPYLKESRKNKVEQYIQLFNITKAFEVFNKASGGDSKK